MDYTADNMARFLGNGATDEQAEKFAEYLLSHGWELDYPMGEVTLSAYRNGVEMTDQEWDQSLEVVFG